MAFRQRARQTESFAILVSRDVFFPLCPGFFSVSRRIKLPNFARSSIAFHRDEPSDDRTMDFFLAAASILALLRLEDVAFEASRRVNHCPIRMTS